jgi:hypothetical protein
VNSRHAQYEKANAGFAGGISSMIEGLIDALEASNPLGASLAQRL